MIREELERMETIRLFGLLIWGEARGEPVEGQIAVACVARNRWQRPRWWGKNPRSVMLQERQFSAFNPEDANFALLDHPAEHSSEQVWQQCMWIAEGVYFERIMDNTGGADHYVTSWLMKQLQERAIQEPNLKHWALEREPTGRIARHVFFRLESD